MRFLFRSAFVMIVIVACFLVSNVQADSCARMEKSRPWDIGTEIPLDCETVSKAILPPLKDIPDLKALPKLSYADAESVLGPPYHQFISQNKLTVFFQKNAPIVIYYGGTENMPSKIGFSVSGHLDVNEIPSILNLGPAPSPFDGPAGPFWNDLGGFAQIEVHTPDYKYEGEFIYPVILHVNEGPISIEQAEKIKRAKREVSK